MPSVTAFCSMSAKPCCMVARSAFVMGSSSAAVLGAMARVTSSPGGPAAGGGTTTATPLGHCPSVGST
eukprot:6490893-Amphidinium_carterae.1